VEFSPVLVYQPVLLAVSESPYTDDKEAGARVMRVMYFQPSMLIPQMGRAFSVVDDPKTETVFASKMRHGAHE
jgi:gamma-glutamyl:cysteine ligase YbdK (ATP-grasp superfamily)